MEVNIIGAGLAGSEASYQLLKRGVKVNLYEMKPNKFTEAHKNPNFAELVCSNSLKSSNIGSACGLLKEELRRLDSLLIKCADKCAVPAGASLSVDRNEFSEMVTQELKKFPNLKVIDKEVTSIDKSLPLIIATGPLTSEALSKEIAKLIGSEYLYFFDAIAPIISYDSIDFDTAFFQDRYNKGEPDYINCPMEKDEYLAFYNELVSAETVKLHEFENSKVFEGCMPVEVLAKRGVDSLRFGPMKPVGLTDKQGRRPYAVVQLRKETKQNDFYNMVGFQTNLTFGEQKRVFSMIPSLKNAEFLRYGTMHRNTYINAPTCLTKHFNLKNNDSIFFAGQISGVEGYVESIMSGLVCGLNMFNYLNSKPSIDFGVETMVGGICSYFETASKENFQPISANMGLLSNIAPKIKDKKEKGQIIAKIALENIETIIRNNQILTY